jgi:hypothetical protein
MLPVEKLGAQTGGIDVEFPLQPWPNARYPGGQPSMFPDIWQRQDHTVFGYPLDLPQRSFKLIEWKVFEHLTAKRQLKRILVKRQVQNRTNDIGMKVFGNVDTGMAYLGKRTEKVLQQPSPNTYLKDNPTTALNDLVYLSRERLDPQRRKSLILIVPRAHLCIRRLGHVHSAKNDSPDQYAGRLRPRQPPRPTSITLYNTNIYVHAKNKTMQSPDPDLLAG